MSGKIVGNILKTDRYHGTKAYHTHLTLVCYNLSQNHNLHTMHKTNASSSLSPLLLFWCCFPAKSLTVFLYRVYTSSFSFFLVHFLLCSKKLYRKMIVYRALYMDRVKRIWYLSPMRAVKVQASQACASAQSRQNLRCLLIQAVSQEEPSNRKPDPWPLWMAGPAQLKFVMTECSKTQNRLTGLI